MTLTKASIAETLYHQLDVTRADAANLVDAVLELVREELEGGKDVKLARFGVFRVRRKNSRAGRNPKTGEEVTITARKVVTFRPSVVLRDRVRFGQE